MSDRGPIFKDTGCGDRRCDEREGTLEEVRTLRSRSDMPGGEGGVRY